MQRQLLRKEKFDRQIEVPKVNDPVLKNTLQERLYTIDEELRVIEEQANELRSEKRKP